MVVFTCNNCGDSLQKPKVAKHYQFACRNAVSLTCMDCHKDFRGDEYISHTKCITENEKYGSKDYVQKPSANKGEKKQQAWINVVQNVISNSKSLTVPERNLLNSIANHENIPRKKAKFMNFIKNISKNRVNMECIESVWEKMEKAFKEAAANEKVDAKNNENENSNAEQQNNKEKESNKQKQPAKRKIETDENDNDQPSNKRKNETEATNGHKSDNDCSENTIEIFSWKKTILNIVESKEEISLKKLRKKVLAQYLANFPDEAPEKAASKFEKKLKKVSNISIEDNKVKLTSA